MVWRPRGYKVADCEVKILAGVLNTYASLGCKVPVYRVVPLAVVCRFVCCFSVVGGNPGKITLTLTST